MVSTLEAQRSIDTMIPGLRGWLVSLVLVVVGVLGCGKPAPVAEDATLRKIAHGEVIGTSLRDGRVHAWRGIPFAAPPVADLRWRAPRPVEDWAGTREALASGSPCVQLGGDPLMGDEDCLYLDVFAPAFAPDAVPTGADRLPVMYWIHGGGNSMGSGDLLDVSRLAAEHDVVVVTINYRLGILGWLSHPALRASVESDEDASGNFATLDMIQGLEWVRDNIARFGGDPNRVTIFGESAGGINVFSLLISPRAKGLFHGAIAESGSPVSMTRIQAENYTDDEEEGLPGSSSELLNALLQQEGRAANREVAKEVAAEMQAAEIDAFLRGLSAEALLQPFAAAAEDFDMPIYIVPNVIRDGVVIPTTPPLELLSMQGGYNAVPFIAGTNREESKLFFLSTSPHVSKTFGLPSGLSNERLYDIEGEYGGLMWRAMGADEPLARMRRVQGPSVWAYRFDWDEEPTVLGADLSKMIGAAHAVEMIFVFGLTDLGFANRFLFDDVESAERLSKQIRSYWTNFAHTLRPGRGQGGDLPEWPAWGAGQTDEKYIIFDSDRDKGITFGTDEIDQSFVFDRAAKDPRLLNDSERCGVFKNFVQWTDKLTVDEYARINDGACAAYPIGSRLAFPSLSHSN